MPLTMDIQLVISLMLCVVHLEAKSALVLENQAVTEGHKFEYQIGNKQFLSLYKINRIVERGKKRLPEWLTYDNNSSVLFGVPLKEDIRVYSIKIKASCIDEAGSECQDDISKTFRIVVKEDLKSSGSRGSHTLPMHDGNAAEHDGRNLNASYHPIIMQHDDKLVMTSASASLHDDIYVSSGPFANSLPFNQFEYSVHENSVSLPSFSDRLLSVRDSSVSFPTFTEHLLTVHESSASSFQTAFPCNHNEVSFFVSLILHVIGSQISFVEQTLLIHQLSLFISKDTDHIFVSETEVDMMSMKSGKRHILFAGPGNVIESQKDSIEISWLAACGSFEHLTDFSRVLQHNIDSERMTEEIGYNIIAWYMYTDKELSKREKRNARRPRQTGTPSFTFSVPSLSKDESSMTHISFNSPTSVSTLSHFLSTSMHSSRATETRLSPLTSYATSSPMTVVDSSVSFESIFNGLSLSTSYFPSVSVLYNYTTKFLSSTFMLSSTYYFVSMSSSSDFSSSLLYETSSMLSIEFTPSTIKSDALHTMISETPISLLSVDSATIESSSSSAFLSTDMTTYLDSDRSDTISVLNTSTTAVIMSTLVNIDMSRIMTSYLEVSIISESSPISESPFSPSVLSFRDLDSTYFSETSWQTSSSSPFSYSIASVHSSASMYSNILFSSEPTRTLEPNLATGSTVFSSQFSTSFRTFKPIMESSIIKTSSTFVFSSVHSDIGSSVIVLSESETDQSLHTVFSLSLSKRSGVSSGMLSSAYSSIQPVASFITAMTESFQHMSTRSLFSWQIYIISSTAFSHTLSSFFSSDSDSLNTGAYITPSIYFTSTSSLEIETGSTSDTLDSPTLVFTSTNFVNSTITTGVLFQSSISPASSDDLSIYSELSSAAVSSSSSSLSNVVSSMQSLSFTTTEQISISSMLFSTKRSFGIETSTLYQVPTESYLMTVFPTTVVEISSQTEVLPSISPSPVSHSSSVPPDFWMSSVVASTGAETERAPEYNLDTENPASPNSPPRLQNSIDHLEVTIGRYFESQVPENTFNDTEDGGTRNLNLSVSLLYGVPLPTNAWLMFDSSAQTLYGIPINSDFSSDGTVIQKILLTATDSQGQVAKDVISLTYKSEKNINHKFSVTFNTSFASFISDNQYRMNFAQNITKLFNDTSPRQLSFNEFREGSVIVNWGNISLFGKDCPLAEIQKVFGKIEDQNGSFTEEFMAIFQSLNPAFGELRLAGPCLVPVTTPSPAAQAPQNDKTWIEILLPALIVILVIVIIALLLLVCCRHRNAGSKSPSNKPTFLEDRRPIIFPEELEMTDPSLKSKQPLILPSDHMIESAPVVPPHGKVGSTPQPLNGTAEGDGMDQPLPTYGSTTNTTTDPPPYRLPPPYYNPHRV